MPTAQGKPSGVQQHTPAAGFDAEQLQEMREIFAMFDEDGSGSINAGRI
jgi:Ca2+-binding EF-hand superfamily protein